MAVAHAGSQKYVFAAAGDEILFDLRVKRIVWESEMAAPGDALTIVDPTDTSTILFRAWATGSAWTYDTGAICERFTNGLRVHVLGSGTVYVSYE